MRALLRYGASTEDLDRWCTLLGAIRWHVADVGSAVSHWRMPSQPPLPASLEWDEQLTQNDSADVEVNLLQLNASGKQGREIDRLWDCVIAQWDSIGQRGHISIYDATLLLFRPPSMNGGRGWMSIGSQRINWPGWRASVLHCRLDGPTGLFCCSAWGWHDTWVATSLQFNFFYRLVSLGSMSIQQDCNDTRK